MALAQVVPILITLLGDGSNTVFTYALANIYIAAPGGSMAYGTAGVPPSSVLVNNPPFPVTSATVDANGNITITFTSAPPASQFSLEVDLVFNSGAANSTSPTQTANVKITNTSIAVTEAWTGATGSAVPANAGYLGFNSSGNLVGVSASNPLPVTGTITAITSITNPVTIVGDAASGS